MKPCSVPRTAFTFVELMVVIAVIGVLVALLLPAIQAAREAARRSQCSKNLQQIGLAMQSYHDAWSVFPFGQGGTDGGTDLTCNMGELSGWAPLMPYVGDPPLFRQIDEPQTYEDFSFSRFGPRPDVSAHPAISKYRPWYCQPRILLCPSDPEARQVPGRPGQTSYRFSWGDVIAHTEQRAAPRGVFGRNSGVSIAMIADGTSNTIAVSERVIAPQGPQVRVSDKWAIAADVEGMEVGPYVSLQVSADRALLNPTGALDMSPMMWANGRLPFGGFTTVSAPNSPACMGPDGAVIDGQPRFDWGIIPPSSEHPGGVQVVLADGSTRFVSEVIDCGDLTLPEAVKGPSPYGVWGALGTIQGEEMSAEPSYW
ncbi:MAG: DUF1559 domain-containing protein [Planctomycetaceae bacterium]|nr:DUF1559 domain-containing protein [Planctomycetaceae bacterium]